MKHLTQIFTLLLFFTFSTSYAYANDVDSIKIVHDIQKRWAELNYAEEQNENGIKQLEQLAEEAETHALQQPQNAELKIWSAIVLSTLANQKGGLGALSKVKMAKLRLERALEINPEALSGSAYASLGTLYHKVPGWPIGFGNKAKARQHFKEALDINPNGLDINYFYADFLADNKKVTQAIEHLNAALKSPALKGRPIADAGRRAQAQALLDKLSG